jgi:hypothetical protein
MERQDIVEVLSSMVNNDESTNMIAKEIFQKIGVNHVYDIAETLTFMCEQVSGLKESAIPTGREAVTGRVLAATICRAPKSAAVVMKSKYTPVHLRQRPVPISVPLMKRQPYKSIPIPVIPDFPIHPPRSDDFKYTKRLTKE